MEDKEITVTMDRVKGYEFRVKFDGIGEWEMDEPEPLGAGRGPSPSMVLSAAVGNCLSASALFCLRKARVEPRSVKTTVTTSVEK